MSNGYQYVEPSWKEQLSVMMIYNGSIVLMEFLGMVWGVGFVAYWVSWVTDPFSHIFAAPIIFINVVVILMVVVDEGQYRRDWKLTRYKATCTCCQRGWHWAPDYKKWKQQKITQEQIKEMRYQDWYEKTYGLPVDPVHEAFGIDEPILRYNRSSGRRRNKPRRRLAG